MSVLSCHQNKTTLNTAALMEFMLHSKIYTHIVEPELCAKRAGCGCRWLLGQAASNFFFGLNLEVSLNVKGEECTLLLLVSEAVVTSVSPHTCSGTD